MTLLSEVLCKKRETNVECSELQSQYRSHIVRRQEKQLNTCNTSKDCQVLLSGEMFQFEQISLIGEVRSVGRGGKRGMFKQCKVMMFLS